MTATADPVAVLLTDLNRLGVELLADGDRLRFRPRSVVDSQLQSRLRRHKAKVIERLSTHSPVGPAASWGRKAAALLATVEDDRLRVLFRDLFEERAGICQFHGELSLVEAERVAFEELQHAIRAGPGD